MAFGFLRKKTEDKPPSTASGGAKSGGAPEAKGFAFFKKKDDEPEADPAATPAESSLPLEQHHPTEPAPPPFLHAEDLGRWRKLCELIQTHPLFQLVTFDGLAWIDPFSGDTIPAAFDLAATVLDHYRQHDHWLKTKVKSSGTLHAHRWSLYLQENLQNDGRFSLFADDGRWFNPWTRTWSTTITRMAMGNPERFIQIIAVELAHTDEASPNAMASLKNLKRIMAGLPEERTAQAGLSGPAMSTAAAGHMAPGGPVMSAPGGAPAVMPPGGGTPAGYPTGSIPAGAVPGMPGHPGGAPMTAAGPELPEGLAAMGGPPAPVQPMVPTVVLPPAIPFLPGMVSFREANDAETPAVAGMPITKQADLAPEILQKLIDAFQTMTVVAQKLVSRDKPAGKTAAPAEDDPFATADAKAASPESDTQSSDVDTSVFLAPGSNLDVDLAMARLLARQARGEPEEEDRSDQGQASDADGTPEIETSTILAGDSDAHGLDHQDDIPHTEDLDEDLQKARSVQNHLLGGVPEIPGMAIALHFVPFSHIGGDFYQFIKLDEESFFFIVGDVSGHGVQAALVVASIVNTLRMIFAQHTTFDLVELVAELNDHMRSCLLAGQFFTALTGIYTGTAECRRMECLACGHHPALLFGSDGGKREVGPKAMGLGLVKSSMWRGKAQTECVEIQAGDTLVIYTDGVSEVMKPDGTEIGDEVVHASLARHLGKPLEDYIPNVLAELTADSQGTVSDDQTVLVMRFG